MAKKKNDKSINPVTPPHEISSTARARQELNVEENAILHRKVSEISEFLWLPASMSQEGRNIRVARALELYNSLKPAEGAEGMLAMQMVGTHYMAMECLRRANISEQSFQGRDSNLKHAVKLMALYEKQLAALDKHRGKGQQRITVKHVNVAPGGQAIVGTVDTQSHAGGTDDKPAALDAPNEAPIDVTPERQPAKSKAKK